MTHLPFGLQPDPRLPPGEDTMVSHGQPLPMTETAAEGLERVGDERLAYMIERQREGYLTITTAEILGVLTELQSLRSKPMGWTVTDEMVERALDAPVVRGCPVIEYLDFSADDAQELGVLGSNEENFAKLDIIRHEQWRETSRKIMKAALTAAIAVETKPVAWRWTAHNVSGRILPWEYSNVRPSWLETNGFFVQPLYTEAPQPLLDAPEPVAGTWSWEYQLGPHITWTCGDSPPAKGQWVRNVEFKPYAFPERSKAVEPEPVADDGLRGVLDTLGKKQSELAHVLGSRSRASEYLSGKRELTKSAIVKIATAWGVSADVLLGLSSPPLLDAPRVMEEMVERIATLYGNFIPGHGWTGFGPTPEQIEVALSALQSDGKGK